MRCTKAEIGHFNSAHESSVDKKKSNALMLEAFFLVFVLFETYKTYKTLKEEWDFLTSLEPEQRKVAARAGAGGCMRVLSWIGVEPHRVEG